ncbi:SOSS complex subunit B1-A [Aplysia californica]|uniref:SOSS complex subunit B1-A n=1 Tax=Aplysia californica TaxID=6500 RepID=A0ABM0JZL2_APLCA|nr:SOSS complex subunit B1-A [Aplysia californica]XP_005105246.1 SOSS complex subunit B1-A [Aplysia californica]XP_005105247.1 SOSS complex subunit B1-A [Aplysia californica]
MQMGERGKPAGDQSLFIVLKDVRPGMKNLHLMFIVLEVGKPTRTKEGHDVRSCKVADKSGSINLSVWDEASHAIQSGDICKFMRGYASLWKGGLTLYTGKIGEIVKVGEFCFNFAEMPNFSEPNPEYLKVEPPQRKSPTESGEGGPSQAKGDIQGSSSGVRPQLMQIQPGNGQGYNQQRPPARPPLSAPPRGIMNGNNNNNSNVAVGGAAGQSGRPSRGGVRR